MDYEPGTGSRPLFPKMHLETCEGPLSGVKVLVELQTSHIGKGCDRETYSEKSLQKLCGKWRRQKRRRGKTEAGERCALFKDVILSSFCQMRRMKEQRAGLLMRDEPK